MIVIGLMSGTSADGIDAAVVEITGAPPHLQWRLIKHLAVSYPLSLREEIIACATQTGTVDRICALNFSLGEAFADAAIRATEAAELALRDIDLIGSHGQTVWHIPAHSTHAENAGSSTLQIGEGAVIAERTGITTISNLRARDVAAGGHGAPLVAYVDVLLLTHPEKIRAAQNIGGIGNVTFLPGANQSQFAPFAFDTGPGNILIDQIVRRATHGAREYDQDGEIAQRGRIDEILLSELLAHPFLKVPPPKTTGRELYDARFAEKIWQRGRERELRDEDIVATITAYTAESIARAYHDFLPAFPDEVIVSGGGTKNPTLMQTLSERLHPARLISIDELGLPSNAKEAVAFAMLAYEAAHNRQGNLPRATGARHPVILGDITPGHSPSTLAPATDVMLTEANNPATKNIDELPTLEMLQRINAEDQRVAYAVAAELPQIAQAVEAITERMRAGGRLIYVGAGTSGRLGILDASEMPPTFSTNPDQVIGIIAGGDTAIRRSVEGAEDNQMLGTQDIAQLNVRAQDSVVGLAASGRTPYVIGALSAARVRGALTLSITCNRPAPLQNYAEINIALLVGPEVIAGSTRLKAGTAQKMALNLISTGVMIRLGKTFGNLMVDVQPTNAKLRDRARRILESLCELSPAQARAALDECDGEVKTAIVSQRARVSPAEARARLAAAQGSVKRALTNLA